MKTIIKIFLVALVIVLSSNYAVCMEIPIAVSNRIEWDSWYLFGADPDRFENLLTQYKDEKYYPIFLQILENNNKYEEDVVYGVILFSAMLQDKRHLERIKNIHTKRFKNVIDFYCFRIGYKKDESLRNLKKRFDYIVAHPVDSTSIGFLAFIEDVDMSISYLDKLIPKADGAMAEIVCWTVGYLYYSNKNNDQLINKIKKSDSYKVCKDYIQWMK